MSTSCPDATLSRFIIQSTPSVKSIFDGIDNANLTSIIVYAGGQEQNYVVEKLGWESMEFSVVH
ncbi:hypothetical protein EBS02_10815 [bacterium]|nr:hypothetical protein [bacterium]